MCLHPRTLPISLPTVALSPLASAKVCGQLVKTPKQTYIFIYIYISTMQSYITTALFLKFRKPPLWIRHRRRLTNMPNPACMSERHPAFVPPINFTTAATNATGCQFIDCDRFLSAAIADAAESRTTPPQHRSFAFTEDSSDMLLDSLQIRARLRGVQTARQRSRLSGERHPGARERQSGRFVRVSLRLRAAAG